MIRWALSLPLLAVAAIACGPASGRTPPPDALRFFPAGVERAHHRCEDGNARSCHAVATVLANPHVGAEQELSSEAYHRLRNCDLAEVYWRKACALDSSQWCDATPCGGTEALVRAMFDRNDPLAWTDENQALIDRALQRFAGTPDEETALRCRGSDGAACEEIASKYWLGKPPVQTDLMAAALLFDRGCEANDAMACRYLATLYGKEDWVHADEAKESEHYLKSYELLRAGCKAANAEACDELGFVLDDGIGFVQKPALAFRHYERACALGSAAGELRHCWRLAVCHIQGKGAPVNLAEAARLLTPMCAADLPYACRLLAQMTMSGEGVPANPAEGLRLMTRACDLGDGDACGALAEHHRSGTSGFPVDEAKAAAAQRRACELGHEESCR